MTPAPNPTRLSEVELEAWRGFLRTHTRLISQLDRELMQRRGLSLSSYEVLLRLSESPGGRMRMKDIASSLLLSRSGITRIVAELERQGLVQRQQVATDGRGLEASLTRRGRTAFRAAQKAHLVDVRSDFLDRLSPSQLKQLARIWSVVGLAEEPVTTQGT